MGGLVLCSFAIFEASGSYVVVVSGMELLEAVVVIAISKLVDVTEIPGESLELSGLRGTWLDLPSSISIPQIWPSGPGTGLGGPSLRSHVPPAWPGSGAQTHAPQSGDLASHSVEQSVELPSSKS
jgi:hypothetical protein